MATGQGTQALGSGHTGALPGNGTPVHYRHNTRSRPFAGKNNAEIKISDVAKYFKSINQLFISMESKFQN